LLPGPTSRRKNGIISAISTHLSNRHCDIIESAQFVDHDAQRFFQRIAFDAPDEIGGEMELVEELRPIVPFVGVLCLAVTFDWIKKDFKL
jgi:formyltetrahydrofolate hydrolase